MKSLPSLLFLSVALLLGGCDISPPQSIRIGTNPWPGYEFLYLAQEKGFFKDIGVDVEIVEFSSLGDVRRAYEQEQIDGFGGTLIELIQARANTQRRPQVVMATDFSNGADVILGRPEIESMQQLRSGPGALYGKKVGVEVGSLGVYMLHRALQQAGMTLGEIQIVPMAQLNQEQAFLDGGLDATVTYPPVSTRLSRFSGINKLFGSDDIPGEVVDILAIDQALIEQRPQDVEKVIAAWDRALDYAKTDTETAYHIMAERERITSEEFADSLKGIKTLTSRQQLDLFDAGGTLETAIAETYRVLKETKQITDTDHKAGTLLAPQILRRYLESQTQ